MYTLFCYMPGTVVDHGDTTVIKIDKVLAFMGSYSNGIMFTGLRGKWLLFYQRIDSKKTNKSGWHLENMWNLSLEAKSLCHISQEVVPIWPKMLLLWRKGVAKWQDGFQWDSPGILPQAGARSPLFKVTCQTSSLWYEKFTTLHSLII